MCKLFTSTVLCLFAISFVPAFAADDDTDNANAKPDAANKAANDDDNTPPTVAVIEKLTTTHVTKVVVPQVFVQNNVLTGQVTVLPASVATVELISKVDEYKHAGRPDVALCGDPAATTIKLAEFTPRRRTVVSDLQLTLGAEDVWLKRRPAFIRIGEQDYIELVIHVAEAKRGLTPHNAAGFIGFVPTNPESDSVFHGEIKNEFEYLTTEPGDYYVYWPWKFDSVR